MNFRFAHTTIEQHIRATPLEYNRRLDCFLKREDLQYTRSYKIRGALNALLRQGITHAVCASAGNHAQGVAAGCAKNGGYATVYMPKRTPRVKVDAVKKWGASVFLEGDTYDQAYQAALTHAGLPFIHPFDDELVVEGQGTLGYELAGATLDTVVVPVGGGGLLAGVSKALKEYSPHTRVVGVEPAGAASLTAALRVGHPVDISVSDTFVDGAAVGRVGQFGYEEAVHSLYDLIVVDEGAVAAAVVALQREGITAEPAGALAFAGLPYARHGKTAILVTGGNVDASFMPEIVRRANIYKEAEASRAHITGQVA